MSTECTLRYIITIMASPTATSAAATTIIKNTKSCALASPNILEKATSSRFTELSISSMHMKMIMAFLRISVPMMPIEKSNRLRKR